MAFLGVAPSDDTNDDRVETIVPGSAAEEAGIQPGDLIVKFDDKPVDRYDDLPPLVKKRKPGDKVAVVIQRNDETLTLEVTLGGIGG